MNAKAVKAKTKAEEQEKFPWAGPALFTAVALALLAFFWWLL